MWSPRGTRATSAREAPGRAGPACVGASRPNGAGLHRDYARTRGLPDTGARTLRDGPHERADFLVVMIATPRQWRDQANRRPADCRPYSSMAAFSIILMPCFSTTLPLSVTVWAA